MFGLCVAIWSVCALLWVTRVEAEVASFEKRMSLLPADGPCFAIVSIENTYGMYRAIETLETEHGPVSIQYHTIGNHNATDHDLVDVVDLPPGVAAHPMHLDLPDGDTGLVCLMQYLGG